MRLDFCLGCRARVGTIRFVSAAVLTASIAGLSGCAQSSAPQSTEQGFLQTCRDFASTPAERAQCEERKPTILQVQYRLGGTSRHASVTWLNSKGGYDTADMRLPKILRVKLPPGSGAQVTAINRDDRGTVTCAIVVSGVTISRSSGSQRGYGSTAGCQGQIP